MNGTRFSRYRMTETEYLKEEVRRLLRIFELCDPTGGKKRHKEWPLKIVGDGDALIELGLTITKLKTLVK